MIQRPKINLSGVDDILQEDNKKKAINLDGVDSVLKKKDSVVTQIKSDSETPIGSSAGKNTNGFPNVKIDSPIPNFDDLKQSTNIQKPIKKGKIVDVKSINEKEKLKKEDSSFFDYLKENLDTGIATVSKSIYDAPGMAYDLVANYVTNPIAEALGADKSQLASSDKLAKDLGFKNI